MNESKNLSVNDLITLRDVIDIACGRGAFQAREMSAVGAVYEKLDSFINQVISAAETEATKDVGVPSSASINNQGDIK